MKHIYKVILSAATIASLAFLLLFFSTKRSQGQVTGLITQGKVVIDTTGLKPANGKDGQPGAKGDQGIQGVAGKDGKDGAGSKNGWVYHIYTATDIDSAIAGLKAGKTGCFFFEATDINKDIVLPWQWPGKSMTLVINFNGVNLNGVIKTELPPTYADAERIATQYKVIIRDGMLTGHGTDTTMSLSCFINSEITNIRSRSAAVAGYFAFTMNARVMGCDAGQMKTAGYVADVLKLPLATDTKRDLQSNNLFFGWERVHNAIGCEYSFGSFGSNNVTRFMCVIEGNEPKTGVTFDDLGLTTVKMTRDLYYWCETKATVAMFKYKLNDGLIDNSGWNSKISPFLVDLTSASGALINMYSCPNLLSGDRIRMPVEAKINLSNCKRVDTAVLFSNGKPPQYKIDYYFQNGYRQEIGNYTWNGAKLVTQP